jgi:FAD/FMN-containing dehydrogenase
MSNRPSAFVATWRAAQAAVAAAGGGWMHGSVLRGVVRCGVPAGARNEVTRALMAPFDGVRIGERLPAHAWSVIPAPAMDRLSRGIRAAFDPTHLLNPGILGELA